MSLGVTCGCMPHLTSLFKGKSPNVPQLSSLKSLVSRLISGVTRRFQSSLSSSNFDRVGSRSANEAYLESQILGSVRGPVKFMQSDVYPQKERLGHATEMQENQGRSTVRDDFND